MDMYCSDKNNISTLNCYEKLFKTLAEESSNIVFLIKNGKTIFISKKCKRILGYSPKQICSSKNQYWDSIVNKFINKKSVSFCYSIMTKKGTKLEVMVFLKQIENFFLGIIIKKNLVNAEQKQKTLALLNQKLIKTNKLLKKIAFTDSHTGLYTHRILEQMLEAEFERAKRDAQNLSIIMIDIDYFRSINDVYGHKFGDLILKQFSDKLRKIVRKYNTIIRYGGEEFIIISPNSDSQNSINFAKRILNTISVTNFGYKKNRINLKLSIAVVSYPQDHIVKAMDMIELSDKIISKAKESGGNRVYSSLDLKSHSKSLSNQQPSAIFDYNYIQKKMDKLNKKINQNLIEAVFAFVKTIECKDHYTGEHVGKTVHFATKIAENIGLSQDKILVIKQAAVLHDLGKVGIREKILLKPNKLTPGEFKEIKEHPLIGANIIRPIQLLRDVVPLILYHHERWDGKGYPMKLKGEEIPIGARIIALADTYQALISNRPYRKAYLKKNAIEIIKQGSGTQFDPAIVDVFLKIL